VDQPSPEQRAAQPLQGSHYLDRAAAQRAVDMALPLIERLVAEPGQSGFLCIVIMDPARHPATSRFEDAVLYEHDIGARAQWDADYAAFANAKARLSWLHGLDTHSLQALRPHVLRGGDTALWGSAVLDGIVVGVSGAYSWYDEAIATAVAACLRALAKSAAQQRPSSVLFLPQS
jgi:uncharacterized protein GlcG (DUF336 family)